MKKVEHLEYSRKNVWEQANHELVQQIMAFAEDYKTFISSAKTERACVRQIIRRAQAAGFQPVDRYERLQPGDRVYITAKEKIAVLAVIGRQDWQKGIRLIGSHTDVPRLDLKPHPLYQEAGLAFFKTHYYGGIKKYQWLTIPLALHGVVCLADGQRVEISIGDRPGDPVFTITDLLPHLAKDQMVKKMTEAVAGEQLNLLIGGQPRQDSDKENAVKMNILALLHEEYGITEEDFISAELEAVPAGAACDVGLDRSMVGAYGQDDRVCVYTSLQALLETKEPACTAVALFVDKEEIGSTGNTGMQGRFLTNALAEIGCRLAPQFNELSLYRMLAQSRALSADVTAALDPNFDGVLEKLNAARLGGGVVITKYTGARGKYHTNDANAEYVALLRNLLNRQQITWQTGELGKVDQGGGGTIAHMMAELGMEVIDCGVALLSMHAPLEIASKADIYECYRAYKAFFND
ncbi:aminopeptidase [Desulforamulus hydrothermalis]|uniref:M18 family aminopeptidase n=1 Tax=Desulforamulus hydrothermalis Lam5 = DSM 18033 TaxID=1121428 RepID=K8DZ79_9FIRM|nr:aminopeptidase [Desulforamulus hydrothermalis]CCO08337.1 putative M18 family aminopeptidase 1 [Desulforamulus hydrothermalis Lam5 = DSM 18033]SHH44908.1 Aspartyl aminopeptidase [Desulforamulus hydrothermalis Lam5 = DSM 18033]